MYTSVHKLFITILVIVKADCISLNNSYTCGILQALADPTRDSKYRFGGIFIPNSGIKWFCKRRSVLDKCNFKLKSLKNSLFYKDSDNDDKDGYITSEDISSDNEACRIMIVNPLSLLIELKKRKYINLELKGDKLKIIKNGLLKRFFNNQL